MAGLGADWDFNNLESLIEDRYDIVVWEKAVAEPTRRNDHYASQIEIDGKRGNEPDLYSAYDNEIGIRYRDAQAIRGMITSLESGRNKRLLEMGYAVPGDCVFSPSLKVGPIGDFDRITMTNPVPIGSGQTIVRGAASLADNQRLDHDVASNEDRLWYFPSCTIWCEDANGVLYSEGSDFVFEGKRIQWVGESPSIGTSYTLKYQAYLEWIAYSTPFSRFDRSRSLGQRVMLRKKHVAMVNNPLDTPQDREEDEIDFTTRTKV